MTDFVPESTNVTQTNSAGEIDAAFAGLRERIREVVEFNGHGFWHSCSGCYETEDGYPVGHYPHSIVLGCDLGGGCSECGGLGATWDGADYSTMVDDMRRDDRLEERAKSGGVEAEAAAREYLASMEWLPDYVKTFLASGSPPQAAALPADVIALVLAGRAVIDNDGIADGEAGQSLDRALEAFSSRVCYDDDGGDLPEAHADPCTCGRTVEP